MAGLKVVPVKALSDGSLDLEDLKTKAEKHKDNLAAFMVSVSRSLNRDLTHGNTIDYLSVDIWRLRRWCARCEQVWLTLSYLR